MRIKVVGLTCLLLWSVALGTGYYKQHGFVHLLLLVILVLIVIEFVKNGGRQTGTDW